MEKFFEKIKNRIPLILIILIFIMVSGSIFQEKFFKNENDKEMVSVRREYGSQLIDINLATYEELMSLSGIGPTKAKEIIKYREEIGNFRTIEELMNVSGIGEATFQKIKDRIIVSNNNDINTQGEINRKININFSSVDELDNLPGIGPTKAQEIVNYREKHGEFKSYDDLLNVNGIGPKTLEKIKPYIEF